MQKAENSVPKSVYESYSAFLNAWEEQGWETPELIEDTVLNQVTLILKMK